MAASETVLNKIHEFFAQYLLDLLVEEEDIYNSEGEVVGTRRRRLSAPEMGVITKFLKDNNISFAGGEGDDEEIEEMKRRAREAAIGSGFSREDIEQAVEGLDFRSAH